MNLAIIIFEVNSELEFDRIQESSQTPKETWLYVDEYDETGRALFHALRVHIFEKKKRKNETRN